MIEVNSNDATTDINKVLSMLDYLIDMASIRSIPIRNYRLYERLLWVSDVPNVKNCDLVNRNMEISNDPDIWLEIRKYDEPEIPPIPNKCAPWIMWNVVNSDDPPTLKDEIQRDIPSEGLFVDSDGHESNHDKQYLVDYPHISDEWQRYISDKWTVWKGHHDDWVLMNDLYQKLFAIHQDISKLGEEYEFVLAMGLFEWRTPNNQEIDRHVVVANASIEMDAELAKITVRAHPDGCRLRPEYELFEPDYRPHYSEAQATGDLKDADDIPWATECVEKVLQSVVNTVSANGRYYSDMYRDEHKHVRQNPVITYAPAFILRKRSSKGLIEVLRGIKANIEQGHTDLGELGGIAEVTNNRDIVRGSVHDSHHTDDSNTDGSVFFPKPANDEQMHIIHKLRTSNGVLVQGPPGTGKSHTIANLICHLLATGQRILITAKTPRALLVLHELLPVEIRPLCISLLGEGMDEREALERSVGAILTKSDTWSSRKSITKIAALESKWHDHKSELSLLTKNLHDIRNAEINNHTVVPGVYEGTAAYIARSILMHQKTYGWFVDHVSPDSSCPFTANQLIGLLHDYRLILNIDRDDILKSLPVDLVDCGSIYSQFEQEIELIGTIDNLAPVANQAFVEQLSSWTIDDLKTCQSIIEKFVMCSNQVTAESGEWVIRAVQDVLSGKLQEWKVRLLNTEELLQHIAPHVTLADITKMDITGECEQAKLIEDANKRKKYISECGESVIKGAFNADWRNTNYISKSVRLNGQPCTSVADLSRLITIVDVNMSLQRAMNFWEGVFSFETSQITLLVAQITSLCDTVRKILVLHDYQNEIRDIIDLHKMTVEPVWADHDNLRSILHSCDCVVAQHQLKLLRQSLSNAANQLREHSTEHHPIHNVLAKAIEQRSITDYTSAFNQVQTLKSQQTVLMRFENLNAVCPELVKQLYQDDQSPVWENRLANIEGAWQWAQACSWLRSFSNQSGYETLTVRTIQVEDEIKKIIAELASLHAWSFCFSRLAVEHKEHMTSWQLAMKRLGKATGKQAWRYRREAQTHLSECNEAVPGWIMPLHRIWDTITPRQGMFDVIIIDEASQCSIEALPLFYLAKKIIIVGDDQQISPEVVGINEDKVFLMQRERLSGFQHTIAFDLHSSLFDHGRLRYGSSKVSLREHFRCMPEIIRFSNEMCYSSSPLVPLRQYPPDRCQ